MNYDTRSLILVVPYMVNVLSAFLDKEVEKQR